MNLLNVDFRELYARHLCRHSQFGINVLHLVAVVVIYVALLGVVGTLPGAVWIIPGLLAAYVLVLFRNIPLRLLLVNLLTIGVLVGVFLTLPRLSVWVYAVLIILAHRFQVWHHRVYDKSRDMSEFSQKYRKGPLLAVLLALYELPILLNYLVFDRRSWTA